MFRRFVLLLFFIFPSISYSADGQITIQYTNYSKGYLTLDTQLNIGQTLAEFRPFIQVDYLSANRQGIINDSQINYVGGFEVKLPKNLKLELGGGYYQPLSGTIEHNEFGYFKVIYSFDTGS